MGDSRESQIVTAACVVLAVAGIIIIAYSQEPPPSVGSLTRGMIGKKVSVSGEMGSIRHSNGNTFLTISGNKVVAFSGAAVPHLLEGKKAKATGEVTLYRGSLELIADEVLPCSEHC